MIRNLHHRGPILLHEVANLWNTFSLRGISINYIVHCCDRKSQATSAQSFTLWQQATIEMTRRDRSVIACSHHRYMGVILHAPPVRGESRIQRISMEKLQHHNHHECTEYQQPWASGPMPMDFEIIYFLI